MNSSVTDVIESYANVGRKIIRKEIEFYPVAEFRKSLIAIFSQLDRTDERQRDIAVRIWSIISRLMTSTADFDKMLPEATEGIFVSQSTVRENWGHEIALNYERAVGIAYALIGVQNPMANHVVSTVKDCIRVGKTFAVLCPRIEISDLQAALVAGGIDSSLVKTISTVVDYRLCDYLDTLIKIGPMRTQGRARTADSLLTSPKCETIIQVVWEKSPDEQTHGYDPIVPVSRGQSDLLKSALVEWSVQVYPFVVDDSAVEVPTSATGASVTLQDDLSLLSGLSREYRSAVLLTLDLEYGILSAPAGKMIVLSTRFDGVLIAEARSAATIEPGSFVGVAGEYTSGLSNDAERGVDNYSSTWKAKLADSVERAPNDFVKQLEKLGLDLTGLRSAIRHWCTPTSTVIHAPQKSAHFEIVCRAIGLSQQVSHRGVTMPFWRAAWSEISISRGEAILAGMHNAEMFEEAVLSALSRLDEQTKSEISKSTKTVLPIPVGNEGGYVPLTLYKVVEVESGYQAPDSELRKILLLEYMQQWQ